jgi:hypothetical protein
MARQTASSDGNPNKLEEDVIYVGVLVTAAKVKSKSAQYPEDQIQIDWEMRQGAKQRDWLSLKLGMNKSTGQPSKLRQLLNALAEKPKDAELWFDADTLEWGYDLEGDDETPAYAVLTPGMVVSFKGELREGKYKVTRYAAPAKAKAKSKATPVDVDPDEIPF